MKKYLTLLLALLLILACSTAAMASSATESAELAYRQIEITIDGNTLIPRDVNGNATEPFIINGTTYLPVRAVANGLGLDVAWDSATSTITLTSGGCIDYGYGTAAASTGKKTATLNYRDIKLVIDGEEITPRDANGNATEPFIINGTTYLPIRAVGSALGAVVNWYAATSTVELRQYVQTQSITTITENGKSKIAGYSYTCTYDERGNQLSLRYQDGDYWKTTYNENNQILTDESLFAFDDGDGYLEKIVNTYDENGRLSKSVTTVKDTFAGNTTNTVTETAYTYDNSGNCILETGKGTEDGAESSSETVRTFDAKGNCLSETIRETFLQDETPASRETVYTYTYDAQGRELSSKMETATVAGDSKEEDIRKITRTYDAQGNELNSHTQMSNKTDGVTLYETTWDATSTYDAKGNLLSLIEIMVELEDGGTSLVTRVESRYRYDENGRLLEDDMLFSYWDGSSYRYQTSYTYNEKGQLSKTVETVTDEQAQATVTTATYTYGANGRDCTIDSVCSDGSTEKTVETFKLLTAK